jgi:hypothetical protein
MIWGYLLFRKPPHQHPSHPWLPVGPGWLPHRGSADHWLQHGESNLSLGDLRSDSNAGGTLGATTVVGAGKG